MTHLVHLAIELDPHIVGIAMIGRDVVADDVTARPPHQSNVVLGQEVAGAVQLRPVPDLEGDVVELGLRVIDEIDRVMIDAAAHEAK